MLSNREVESLTSEIQEYLAMERPSIGDVVLKLKLNAKECFKFTTLSDQNFEGVDVTGWNFSGADLRGSRLKGVKNFNKAIFSIGTLINSSDLKNITDWSPALEQGIMEQVLSEKSSHTPPYDANVPWSVQYERRKTELKRDNSAIETFDEVADTCYRSLSLNPLEKFRVLEALPTLSQFQKDELVKTFENETIKFSKLAEEHPNDVFNLITRQYSELPDASNCFESIFKKRQDSYISELRRKIPTYYLDKDHAVWMALVNGIDFLVGKSKGRSTRSFNDHLFAVAIPLVSVLRRSEIDSCDDLIEIIHLNCLKFFTSPNLSNQASYPILKMIYLGEHLYSDESHSMREELFLSIKKYISFNALEEFELESLQEFFIKALNFESSLHSNLQSASLFKKSRICKNVINSFYYIGCVYLIRGMEHKANTIFRKCEIYYGREINFGEVIGNALELAFITEDYEAVQHLYKRINTSDYNDIHLILLNIYNEYAMVLSKLDESNAYFQNAGDKVETLFGKLKAVNATEELTWGFSELRSYCEKIENSWSHKRLQKSLLEMIELFETKRITRKREKQVPRAKKEQMKSSSLLAADILHETPIDRKSD